MSSGTDAATAVSETAALNRAEPGRGSLNRALIAGSKFGGPALLVALVIVYSVALPHTFLTVVNIRALLSQQAVPGILAAALLLPLVAGEFDFSGGSIIGLAAVALVQLTGQSGLNWPTACLIILAAAAGVGAINGVLISRFGYNSFVATLASGGVLGGVALVRSQGETLYQGIPARFLDLGRGMVAGVPYAVIYLAVVFLVVAYVLRQTAFGRYHEALGKGRAAAQLAGVSYRRHILIAFVASAVIAAMAGLLLVANLGSAPPNVGDSYILSAFAAAFLGSTMFRPGSFNASGAIVAILLIAVGVNGMTLAGVSSFIQQIFTGALLLIAVGISRLERATRQ
jgi:ribose transport system permease protein